MWDPSETHYSCCDFVAPIPNTSYLESSGVLFKIRLVSGKLSPINKKRGGGQKNFRLIEKLYCISGVFSFQDVKVNLGHSVPLLNCETVHRAKGRKCTLVLGSGVHCVWYF